PSILPRPLPISILFPYTTLFRSISVTAPALTIGYATIKGTNVRPLEVSFTVTAVFTPFARTTVRRTVRPSCDVTTRFASFVRKRSEEHTSELQSHLNLVCRLLLE